MPSWPSPRANPDLEGHAEAETALARLYESGRLPHALLLTGPQGIGKATLAFRFARFVLAGLGQGGLFGVPETRTLYVDPENGVSRRVAAGGHADLLTIERAYDPKRRRLRGDILVEDTREIAGFLRLTAAEEGWRIVVMDGAEMMNRNAANAVLKILEEPPRRALLLLVSHSPGRLLPTIRSRCRRFPLQPLSTATVIGLLHRYRPELPEAEAAALAELSGGSIGRALELAEAGGIALYRSLIEVIGQAPRFDVGQLHAFADRLARPEAEDAYRTVTDLIARVLGMASTAALRPGQGRDAVTGEGAVIRRLAQTRDPAFWAALSEEIGQSFGRTDGLNLDRKQALLGAFFAIEDAAR